MRIGLFTDSYRPSINGIVYVVESTKKHLEELGHEVFVFCPSQSILPSKQAELHNEDGSIVRISSIKGKGLAYDDYDLSLFIPAQMQRKIKKYDLDVIHFFTPGQMGILGMQTAFKNGIPIVAQHCTDLAQYAKHYSAGMLLPGLLTLISMLQFMLRMSGSDRREIAKNYLPHRTKAAWNKSIIERTVNLLYSKCDAVISLSRKSQKQLKTWQKDPNYQYVPILKPDGVNALPASSVAEKQAFLEKFNLKKDDEIILFVGRLGAEKNLDMLIPVIEQVSRKRPHAKLVFVGDYEHRPVLEAAAARSAARDRILFTGALARETLDVAYGSARLFVFPSLTDTQAWVLHEAAHAGLPIVMADSELSEVVKDGENGYIVRNAVRSFAKAIEILLSDRKLQEEMGKKSKKLAGKLTEKQQIKKLEKIYLEVIDRRENYTEKAEK